MQTQSLTTLQKVIIYLARKGLFDLTRTKLVKLLYLIDLEYWTRKKKTLTGLNYVSYYYGPYSEEIIDAIQELQKDQVIQEFSAISPEGRQYYIYNLRKKINLDELSFRKKDLEIIEEVLGKYKDLSLDEILEQVYKSQPYKRTKKGHAIFK